MLTIDHFSQVSVLHILKENPYAALVIKHIHAFDHFLTLLTICKKLSLLYETLPMSFVISLTNHHLQSEDFTVAFALHFVYLTLRAVPYQFYDLIIVCRVLLLDIYRFSNLRGNLILRTKSFLIRLLSFQHFS